MDLIEEKKKIILQLMNDKHYVPMKFKELVVILNVKKEILEESDIKIGLGCDDCSIYFDIFVNGVKIYNNKFENNCGFPDLNFLLDTDY